MRNYFLFASLILLTIGCAPNDPDPDICQNSPRLIGRTWVPEGYDPDQKDNDLAKIRFDRDGFIYVESVKDDPYKIESCNIIIETNFGTVIWEIISLNSVELVLKSPLSTITYY